MLILTRRIDEIVRVGDEIQIILLGVAGRSARIGIHAPSDILIYREEIYRQIVKQKLEDWGSK